MSNFQLFFQNRPQKNDVRRMSERNVKQEMLFEFRRSRDEFISCSVVSRFLSHFFAVLIFCFFSIKRKEEGSFYFQKSSKFSSGFTDVALPSINFIILSTPDFLSLTPIPSILAASFSHRVNLVSFSSVNSS